MPALDRNDRKRVCAPGARESIVGETVTLYCVRLENPCQLVCGSTRLRLLYFFFFFFFFTPLEAASCLSFDPAPPVFHSVLTRFRDAVQSRFARRIYTTIFFFSFGRTRRRSRYTVYIVGLSTRLHAKAEKKKKKARRTKKLSKGKKRLRQRHA